MFKNPFPPLGPVFICQSWPISFSPNAVCSYVSQELTNAGRPKQKKQVLHYDEIKEVKAISNDILINSRIFAKCHSQRVASFLSGFIRELVRLNDEAGREKAIINAIESTLDIQAIEQRYNEFRKHSLSLRIYCNVLWIYLFALCPILIWQFGFKWVLFILSIGIFILQISILIIFYLSHKFLCPEDKKDRITQLLKMLFAPPLAIRAIDTVSINILDIFHPLAVLVTICPKGYFQKFTKKLILDLRYPTMSIGIYEEIKTVDKWFRGQILSSLEVFLEKNGIDIESIIKPQYPTDDTCHSLCPRCQCEYRILSGNCADCGLNLLPVKSQKK